MALNNVKDGLYKIGLAAGYTHASSTTITLASGKGASMPAVPFLLSLVQSSGYGGDSEVSRVFAVTARSTDVLTASIASGYTDDTNFSTSDYAEVRMTSQLIGDLNSAMVTAQTTLAGLGTAATQASSAFDASGAAAAVLSTSLQKSSNLSDLASATTAATNLGLGTGNSPTFAGYANIAGLMSALRHAAGPWGMPIGGQRGTAGYGAILSNGTDPTTTFGIIIPIPNGATSLRVVAHNLAYPGVASSLTNLTVSGAVEWPLGSVWPLRWNGSNQVTMVPLTAAVSDPISLPTLIPPGSNIRVRMTCIQAGSTKWPLGPTIAYAGGTNNNLGDGMGCRITNATNASPIVITTDGNHNFATGNTCLISNVNGNTAANGTWTVTKVSATTFSLNSSTGNGAFSYLNYNAQCIGSDMSQVGSGYIYGQAGSYPIYSPLAVLAVPVTNTPSVVGFGDSVLQGSGDSLQYPNNGYLERAIHSSFPYVNYSIQGTQAYQLAEGAPALSNSQDWVKMSVSRAGDYVVNNLGVNDASAGRTLAQLQADTITLAQAWSQSGQRVLQMTVTPHTTSTDSWATATNQSTTTGETVRTGFNDWLRDGAPMTLSGYTYTPVTTGTSPTGVLRTQYWNGSAMTGSVSAGHPLWCVGDAAKLVEVNSAGTLTLDGGRWAVASGTTDGLHPGSAGHATMAAAIPTASMVAF